MKPAKDWVSLKYLDLASALRKAWVDSKSDQHSIGRAWLALYIASIVPGALESDLTQLSEDDVEIYLGQKIPSPKGEPQMKSVVPAASPEVDHYLRHVKSMDQILDDRKNADPSDYEIVEIVYDRAKEKTTELLDDLKKALDSVASRLFRSDEKWCSEDGGWGCYRAIYLDNRARTHVGYIGGFVGVENEPNEQATLFLHFDPEGD